MKNAKKVNMCQVMSKKAADGSLTSFHPPLPTTLTTRTDTYP